MPQDINGYDLLAPGATPEQIAQQRRIAEHLLNPANAQGPIAANGTLYYSPMMGVGNVLQGVQGDVRTMIANQLQRQMQGQQGQQYGTAVNQMSQPIARQLLGQNAPTAAPGQSAALPFSGTPDLKSAILMQESGNNPNIRPSVQGAVGPGQIMPATFSQYAKPGEAITDPKTNTAVSGRILDDYMTRYNDPARAAVAYFSGPGNVAPPGSPTPWVRDTHDANGKSVSSYVADIQRRTQPQQMAQNGAVDPRLLGAMEANPAFSDATKQMFRGLVEPKGGTDVYGRPTITSPQNGQRALPVGPGVQPGVMAPTSVTAPNASISTSVPVTPPNQPGGAPSYGGGNGLSGVQPLVDTAQKFGQQGAGAAATQDQIKADVGTAFGAIGVQQTLRTMANDIEAHGDKMSFGPTADWVNNFKRGIAQHAPGFMSQKDIEGLASADSFEKLSAQLQTLVGRQVGATDASLFQGMKSVPGQHNSKEGAIALIKMLDQVAGLNSQFMQENFDKLGQMGPGGYLAAKNKFYDEHPIINPLTGKSIRLDLNSKVPAGSSDGFRIVR